VTRKLAQLGGTTTAGDCLVALAYLLWPGRLVRGPELAACERAFARRIGVRHARSFATGRAGLYGILRALGIGPGDEVLLQVPTHIVVANAIRHTGARPVFVDCLPSNWNIDLAHAARLVGPRTRALVLQHTFGIPADPEAARAFTDAHGLVLVEDCVHALGATWKGRALGSFGRAAFFSTEETKMVSSTMGGMVVTDDDVLALAIDRFQQTCRWPPHGLVARYLVKLIAYHLLTQPRVHAVTRALYEALGQRQPLPTPTTAEELRGGRREDLEQRLANGQAGLVLRQLRRLDENVARRRAVSALYARLLRDRGFAVPSWPAAGEPSWVRFPVTVPDREAAVRATRRHTVLGTWFTSVLEEATDPAQSGYVQGSCPVAERAADTLVNLPTHPRVRDRDALTIAGALPAPGR